MGNGMQIQTKEGIVEIKIKIPIETVIFQGHHHSTPIIFVADTISQPTNYEQLRSIRCSLRTHSGMFSQGHTEERKINKKQKYQIRKPTYKYLE